MTSDFFLKIDGIDGQSEDKGHSKWVELINFKFGATQNVTIQRGADVSGRGQFEAFEFKHPVDAATPKLLQFCMSGQKIPKVELSVCRAIAGAQTEVLNVKLENVKIASAVISGEEKDGVVDPVEVVKLVYGKANWKVVPIKADNSKGGAIETKFDQIANA